MARVGGDEFFVCMECSIEPEPLVKRIYETVIGEYDGIDVSVSIGIATAKGEEGSYDDLFRSADHALYQMKAAGRGGYIFAERMLSEAEALSAISAIDAQEEDNIQAVRVKRS